MPLKQAVAESESGAVLKPASGKEPDGVNKKKANKGTGVRLTSLNNLKKELLEKSPEEMAPQAIPAESPEFEEIDRYAFQQVWKSYLSLLEGQKKHVILKILEAFPPEIVGSKTVLIRVGTESYLSTLNSEREDLYYFLKKELDKKAIDLVIQVDKKKSKSETARKPYTAGEKFNHMLQKNPKLQDLKDRLKLELDY